MTNPRINKRNGVGVLVVETGIVYKNRTECAKALNASPQLVSNCLTGRIETCKGYHLELVDVDYEADLMAGVMNEIECQKLYPYECTWAVHPHFKDVLFSTNGHGMRCNGGKWEYMAESPTKQGYRTVHVHGKNRLLHVLVAETFISNPHNKPWVNHDDGNKANNKVSNLLWSTPSENELHAYRTGLKQAHHKGRKVKVVETGKVYPSIKACANDLNTYGPSISRCLSGDRSTHLGYHFEYVDEEDYPDAY